MAVYGVDISCFVSVCVCVCVGLQPGACRRLVSKLSAGLEEDIRVMGGGRGEGGVKEVDPLFPGVPTWAIEVAVDKGVYLYT